MDYNYHYSVLKIVHTIFMIDAGKRSELQLLFANDKSSELRVKLLKFVSKVVFKELPLLFSYLLNQLKNEWVGIFNFIFFHQKTMRNININYKCMLKILFFLVLHFLNTYFLFSWSKYNAF